MVNEKKLIFALVAQNAPWWMLGEATKKSLAQHGFEVEVSSSGGRIQQYERVLSGEAAFGANQQHALYWAYHGTGYYEGRAMPRLRAIARLDSPTWLGFAVTYESRLTSIEQIRDCHYPLRIVASHGSYIGGIGSINFVIDRIFEAYGFSLEDLLRSGAKLWTSQLDRGRVQREHNFDVMLGQVYAGFGPVGKLWQEATILNNLRFLPVTSDILDNVCKKYDLQRGLIPKLLLRGVDDDIPTIFFSSRVIFTTVDLDEELAFLTAKSLDEHCEYFLEGYIPFSYNPFRACRDTGAPLHPGAEKYYRSRGYLK
jgi:uncharacterized protein